MGEKRCISIRFREERKKILWLPETRPFVSPVSSTKQVTSDNSGEPSEIQNSSIRVSRLFASTTIRVLKID